MAKSNINAKVRENYELYNQIIRGKKIINDRQIILTQKQSNKNWLAKDAEVTSHVSQGKMFLNTQWNRLDAKDYKFLIFDNNFCNEALSRFDADGATHTNHNTDIPLNQRQIDTPHFHKYDEYGKEIAYKTTFLENKENSIKLQNDINIGVYHFCKEFNLMTQNGDLLQILGDNSLNFTSDIHAGIDFEI